jgi:CO dehydrogenase maturation factor
MKIAVSGKGGVGKTTVTALIARRLTQGGKRVLAVDADPDTNLAACLGFDSPDRIIPIVEMKELIAERMGTSPGAVGAYFKLNPKVSDLPESFCRESNGLKLIVMGMVKRGGAGCACPENTFLKALLSHIILDRDETVLVDMEAGLEHLGRGTTSSMEGLIAVVEPDLRSIETFERVRRLAGDIGVKKVWCVANRVSEEEERAFVRSHVPEDLLLGEIPFSTRIIKSSRGQAPLESAEPAVWEAVDGILAKIQARVESS